MTRCRSEPGYQMNKMSLEKSQIHDLCHFGIVANVTSFLQCCWEEHGNVKTLSTGAEYTHACQIHTDCGRCLLTTWRKHNPMYLIMLRTRRNVTLITSSLKTHHLVWFLSTIREDEFKRCNKIFLIQSLTFRWVHWTKLLPPAFVIRCV